MRVSLAAALVALVLVPAVSAATGARLGKTTYTDAAGDSGKAADLRSLVVANDDLGNYLFTLTFGSPLALPKVFAIFLNTDRNAATGDAGGADYVVAYAGGNNWEFDRWTGSTWEWNGMAGVTGGYGAGKNVVEFSIRKHDIGGARHFDFFVQSRRADKIPDRDEAPAAGHGMWRYDFADPGIANTGSFASTAVAGKTWTVGLRTKRSSNGATVTDGKIFCVAASGMLTLHVVKSTFERHGGDTYATCEFAVPTALKGHFVGSRIDITADGSTASKHFHTTAK